jgi:hypothetical protein
MRDFNWLKEPHPSGEPVVYVSIPEGTKMTPDITEALKRLSVALNGLAKEDSTKLKPFPCDFLRYCTPFENCQPLLSQPCYVLATCTIKV